MTTKYSLLSSTSTSDRIMPMPRGLIQLSDGSSVSLSHDPLSAAYVLHSIVNGTPTLISSVSYSTFVGSAPSATRTYNVCRDASDNIYVVGTTGSASAVVIQMFTKGSGYTWTQGSVISGSAFSALSDISAVKWVSSTSGTYTAGFLVVLAASTGRIFVFDARASNNFVGVSSLVVPVTGNLTTSTPDLGDLVTDGFGASTGAFCVPTTTSTVSIGTWSVTTAGVVSAATIGSVSGVTGSSNYRSRIIRVSAGLYVHLSMATSANGVMTAIPFNSLSALGTGASGTASVSLGSNNYTQVWDAYLDPTTSKVFVLCRANNQTQPEFQKLGLTVSSALSVTWDSASVQTTTHGIPLANAVAVTQPGCNSLRVVTQPVSAYKVDWQSFDSISTTYQVAGDFESADPYIRAYSSALSWTGVTNSFPFLPISQVNDIQLMVIEVNNTAATFAITPPSGWSLLAASPSTIGSQLYVYWARATTAVTNTTTQTAGWQAPSSTSGRMFSISIGNVRTTGTPYRNTVGNSGTGATPSLSGAFSAPYTFALIQPLGPGSLTATGHAFTGLSSVSANKWYDQTGGGGVGSSLYEVWSASGTSSNFTASLSGSPTSWAAIIADFYSVMVPGSTMQAVAGLGFVLPDAPASMSATATMGVTGTPTGTVPKFVYEHSSYSISNFALVYTGISKTVPAGSTLLYWASFDNTALATTPVVTSIATPAWVVGETATWTKIASVDAAGPGAGNGVRGELWGITTTVEWTYNPAATNYVIASLSETDTFTFGVLREYVGINVSLLRAVGTSASSTNGTSSSTVTAQTGDLVIGCATFETNVASTPDSDTTNGSWANQSIGSANNGTSLNSIGVCVQDKVVTATGTQTYNPTNSAGNDGSVLSVAFQGLYTVVPVVAPVMQAAATFAAAPTVPFSHTTIFSGPNSYTADRLAATMRKAMVALSDGAMAGLVVGAGANGTVDLVALGGNHAGTPLTVKTGVLGGTGYNLGGSDLWSLCRDASDSLYAFFTTGSSIFWNRYGKVAGGGLAWTETAAYASVGHGFASHTAVQALWCNTGGGTGGAGHLLCLLSGAATAINYVVLDAGASSPTIVSSGTVQAVSLTSAGGLLDIASDGFGATSGMCIAPTATSTIGAWAWSITSAGVATFGSLVGSITVVAIGAGRNERTRLLRIGSASYVAMFCDASNIHAAASVTPSAVGTSSSRSTSAASVALDSGLGAATLPTADTANWDAFADSLTPGRAWILFTTGTGAHPRNYRLGLSVSGSTVTWDTGVLMQEYGTGSGGSSDNATTMRCVPQPTTTKFVDYMYFNQANTNTFQRGAYGEVVDLTAVVRRSNGSAQTATSGTSVSIPYPNGAMPGDYAALFLIINRAAPGARPTVSNMTFAQSVEVNSTTSILMYVRTLAGVVTGGSTANVDLTGITYSTVYGRIIAYKNVTGYENFRFGSDPQGGPYTASVSVASGLIAPNTLMIQAIQGSMTPSAPTLAGVNANVRQRGSLTATNASANLSVGMYEVGYVPSGTATGMTAALTVSGWSALMVSFTNSVLGDATMAAVSTLGAVAATTWQLAQAMTATTTLAVATTKSVLGVLPLSAAATLTTTPSLSVNAPTALTAASTLLVDSVVTRVNAAALVAVTSLTTSPSVGYSVVTAMTATSLLVVGPLVLGAVTMQAVSGFGVRVIIKIPTSDNLFIGDPGFESVINLVTQPEPVPGANSNWVARWFGSGPGAGTTTFVPGAGVAGGYAARKTWTVTPTLGQDIGMGVANIPVVAGSPYTFRGWIKTSFAATNKAFVIWYDSGNAVLSNQAVKTDLTVTTAQTQGMPFVGAANQWVECYATLIAPANAVKATFVWGPYPNNGTEPNYSPVPGDTADFSSAVVVLSGINGMSTSFGQIGGYRTPSITRSADTAHYGDWSLRGVTTASGLAEGFTAYPFVASASYPAGSVVHQSFWFKAPAGSTWLASGRVQDPAGNHLQESMGQVSVTGTGSWQLVTITPWTYTFAPFRPGIQCRQNATVAGAVFYADDLFESVDVVATLQALATFGGPGLSTINAALALVANATLTTTAVQAVSTSSTFNAASTLNAIRTQFVSLAYAATSTLEVSPLVTVRGAGAFNAASSLSTATMQTVLIGTTFTATTAFSVPGYQISVNASALLADSTLTTLGYQTIASSPAFNAAATLTVASRKLSVNVLTLAAQATLATSGYQLSRGRFFFFAHATLVAATLQDVPAPVSLVAVGRLLIAIAVSFTAKVYRWNGHQWASSPIKRWNGTAYEVPQLWRANEAREWERIQ